MADMFDIVIAGGGPAGLMAAVTAAEAGLTVLLIERKQTISAITRSCCAQWILEPHTHGESLVVKDGKIVFPQNKFELSYSGEMIPAARYIRFSPGGKKLVMAPASGPASIMFDKTVLLQDLVDQAQSLGVTIVSGTHCVDAVEEQRQVTVKLRNADGERFERGRYLIVADGVNSRLGCRLGFHKERKMFGQMQTISRVYEGVECPHAPAFMSFMGTGNFNGGLGSAYIGPKPGCGVDRSDVFEITMGGPVGDPVPLAEKLNFFVEQGFFAAWFKHARQLHTTSAVLEFRSPLRTPARGRVAVAGDAAAFIETYVQGALIYGRSAARSVIGSLREGRGFADYNEHWRTTFGYNQPGEIEKATRAYGITMFSDDELDELFSLTDAQVYTGYINEFNDFDRMSAAFLGKAEALRTNNPALADKVTAHFDYRMTDIAESLQFAGAQQRGGG